MLDVMPEAELSAATAANHVRIVGVAFGEDSAVRTLSQVQVLLHLDVLLVLLQSLLAYRGEGHILRDPSLA